MMLFVMLLVTAQPAQLPPAVLEVPHAVYLTAAGCEAAAARVALPPALRLACVPVDGSTTVLAAAF